MNYNSRVVEQTHFRKTCDVFLMLQLNSIDQNHTFKFPLLIFLFLWHSDFHFRDKKSLISIDSWVLFPLTIFFNSIVGKDKPKIVLKANIFRIPLTYYKHNNPLDYFFMNGLVVDPPACWYCCCVNGLEGCAVAPVDPLA